MFLRTIELYLKTLIKVFLLELIVKARMFGHAFLGRFRDESTPNMMTTTLLTNDGNGLLGGTNCTMQINSHNNNNDSTEAATQIVSRSTSVSISSADTTTTTDAIAIATTPTVNTRAEEAQVRLMQKRKREKEQRNDVNGQFAKLLELLKLIEREAEEIGRQYGEEDSSSSSDAGCYASISTIMALSASTGPTNRVDLLARTIIHLEHLNRTAKKQQVEIAELSTILAQTKAQQQRSSLPREEEEEEEEVEEPPSSFSLVDNSTNSTTTLS